MLKLLLPFAMMLALYGLSSIPGNISPDSPLGAVFQWFTPAWQNLLHIPIYALLALAWLWALEGRVAGPYRGAVLAIMLAILWGVVDECHQTTVPGRHGSLTDVTFNFLGAGFGVALAERWRSRRRVSGGS